MQITQYPRNVDGTPLKLLTGVITDPTGNGGARLPQVPTGPDKSPTDAVGLVLVDAAGAPVYLSGLTLAPEQFGAKPDDPTFDNGPALAAMSAALNAAGGGTISFKPGAVYWIGTQVHNGPVPAGTYTWAPLTLYPVNISGCTKPVSIRGNGAVIRCRAGLLFGTFDDAGVATAGGTGYYGTGISCAYFAMIRVSNCSGGVYGETPELDGNIKNLSIGGLWGDYGRQLPGSGLAIEDCTGPVKLWTHTHHHCLDGASINGPGVLSQDEGGVLDGIFHNNVRNNISFTGGCGWSILNGGSKSYGAGKDLASGMTYSPPGAGVDLEAEGGRYVSRVTIGRSWIADNYGPNLLSPNETSSAVLDITCDGTTVIGTTSFALWCNARYFRFRNGTIAGAYIALYSSSNPKEAAQFYNSRITWDTALSPTGALYIYGGARGFDPTFGTTNIQYTDCSFEYNGPAASPSFDVRGKFHNCNFYCAVSGGYGIHYGDVTGLLTNISEYWGGIPNQPLVTALVGPFAYSGPAYDSFTRNGTRYEADTDRATNKKIYFGSATYDPPSLALAAKTTIQTMTVTGVALGDKVEDHSFSVDLAGARIVAWVSAANTVSYYFINENGANPLDLASGTLRVKVRQA